jgi:lysine 6-dehydrogenase
MKTYAVLGSGMQGTAAAYDLALFASPSKILLGDVSLELAQKSAERVNKLVGRPICQAVQVDALNAPQLKAFLDPVDVLVSAVPYHFQPQVVPVAIEAKTSMIDLGNDTIDTFETLKRDADAKAAGITIVPDTGLAPGLVNSLGNYFIETLDEVDTIRLYCGGLPQHPKPPFDYMLVFSLEGLVGEYTDETIVLRDGEVQVIDTMIELEQIQVEGLGEMEAFTTSGGTSTSPYTLKGKVKNYEYKTVRYPGHCEKMKLFKDFGFWGLDPVVANGQTIVPRDLFCTLMEPALRDDTDRDLVFVRAAAWGKKDGKEVHMETDILDYHDEATGFTSMERLTGFSSAIIAAEIGNGGIPAGCHAYENSMTGKRFVEEIQRRGFQIKFS